MYVFGGYDGSAWLNDMFDFDFERGAWLVAEKWGMKQQKGRDFKETADIWSFP